MLLITKQQDEALPGQQETDKFKCSGNCKSVLQPQEQAWRKGKSNPVAVHFYRHRGKGEAGARGFSNYSILLALALAALLR